MLPCVFSLSTAIRRNFFVYFLNRFSATLNFSRQGCQFRLSQYRFTHFSLWGFVRVLGLFTLAKIRWNPTD